MVRGPAAGHDELHERLIVAALRVVADHGLADLTVRRIAEAADTSTMSVYSRFGSRAGVLDALYRRAFLMLGEAFAEVPRSADHLMDLAMAYRSFALAGPARYAFMFGQLPDFRPGQQLRAETLPGCFGPLVAAVHAASGGGLADATRAAYFLWCVLHGMVGLELADVLKTPGWGVGPPDDGAGERMYVAGVRAMLVGLGLADEHHSGATTS